MSPHTKVLRADSEPGAPDDARRGDAKYDDASAKPVGIAYVEEVAGRRGASSYASEFHLTLQHA